MLCRCQNASTQIVSVLDGSWHRPCAELAADHAARVVLRDRIDGRTRDAQAELDAELESLCGSTGWSGDRTRPMRCPPTISIRCRVHLSISRGFPTSPLDRMESPPLESPSGPPLSIGSSGGAARALTNPRRPYLQVAAWCLADGRRWQAPDPRPAGLLHRPRHSLRTSTLPRHALRRLRRTFLPAARHLCAMHVGANR